MSLVVVTLSHGSYFDDSDLDEGCPAAFLSYNSEEFVRELIEMYRSLPCLWQIKSAEYSNRNKKREAYGKLVALFKQHNPCEKVDESVVRKKIQGLRTVYKKEMNKVVKSMKSGAATDEVYVPSLWYYDLLGFTRDQELPRTMVSSMRQTLDQDPVIPTDTPVGDQHRHDLSTATSDDLLGDEPSLAEATEGSSEDPCSLNPQLSYCTTANKQFTQKKGHLVAIDRVCLAKQILSQQTNTSVDSFANFATDRLGKLEDTQRIHAERVIFETLSKAAAGQLDETSTVHSWMERVPCSRQSMTQTPEAMRSTPAFTAAAFRSCLFVGLCVLSLDLSNLRMFCFTSIESSFDRMLSAHSNSFQMQNHTPGIHP
ncbi:unnamed protein product [Ranitomeya imitator]|uniref:MADF domain-containing protein n=1 Tax=Ranitomeya imitator TaxID=111125 RepID=A0ABN9L3G2_9NEOB|nr:unnamed protein product [Ranitomeya imitator]